MKYFEAESFDLGLGQPEKLCVEICENSSGPDLLTLKIPVQPGNHYNDSEFIFAYPADVKAVRDMLSEYLESMGE